MIGIICSGDREVAPFIPLINNCAISEKSMLKFYSGEIEKTPIVTLFCGVCKTNAAIATQILINTYGCDVIINAGTAGGIDDSVELLDTVVSVESAYWDVHEDILTEFHPWMETIYFKADLELLAVAKKVAAKSKFPEKIHFGRMVTGESFIEDKYRSSLKAKFSPLCVDMETASVAHVCYVN
ncbi:MAG: 5'-methylthioadenosine/S-adenosylhomocysteine nucleosidase [Clostridiales bacterium]|jgi:adenosylhomocysteine nucleosidase|nr:5'-methylthioadenosine/S-adenosylhomocysteine nucleosidase [Clostridiales bacterium]